MPKTGRSGGDFHNGIPNRHLGKKGDTTNDIRSKAQLERARRGELKNLSPDAEEFLRKTEEAESEEGTSDTNTNDQKH